MINQVEKIKEINPNDFNTLVFSAAVYKGSKIAGDKKVAEEMLNVITHILDKYGVKYVDDITGRL